jgi:hypothetical protein
MCRRRHGPLHQIYAAKLTTLNRMRACSSILPEEQLVLRLLERFAANLTLSRRAKSRKSILNGFAVKIQMRHLGCAASLHVCKPCRRGGAGKVLLSIIYFWHFRDAKSDRTRWRHTGPDIDQLR